MAHDVIITCSSKDKPIADAICADVEVIGSLPATRSIEENIAYQHK
jgi:hypothetical protein